MAYSESPTDVLEEYMQLRSVPALLSILFAMMGMFLFELIAAPEVLVYGGYTFSTDHAFILSVAVAAVAFLSSEARSFEMYEQWEQALMGLGFGTMLLQRYITEVNDLVMTNDHTQVLAFLLTVAAWGVLIR